MSSAPVALIVTFNSARVVGNCLASLGDREVVVVDNDSQDDTVAVVERYPGVTLIRRDSNGGFAAGVNAGLQALPGRDVLLLNPDVTVADGSIERLVATLDELPDVGIVAPALAYPDGRRQENARSFKTWTRVLARRTPWRRTSRGQRTLETHLGQPTSLAEPSPVDWVMGAAMLIRAEAATDIGRWDEGFFLYEEDVDWCYRMWRHGWRVLYEPRATMQHAYARQSGAWWDARSRPTRAHWHSLARLARKYPAAFFLGRPIRPSA